MIAIRVNNQVRYKLRWDGHQWKDGAGHVWVTPKTGGMSSDRHGFFPEHAVSIEPNEPKTIEVDNS
jgi:hypothetical protein